MRNVMDEPAFVQAFAAYARAKHEKTGKEAVALIGLHDGGPNRQDPGFVFFSLTNGERHKHRFSIAWSDLEAAVKWLAEHLPGCQPVLAHSHWTGGASPSNMFGQSEDDSGGDVQELGNPLWIRDANLLLARHGLPAPMLHLVYATERGKWRLCEIDQRIGLWVTRKKRGEPVRIRKGWREVRWPIYT